MFKMIGGIVVYGFALLGVTTYLKNRFNEREQPSK